MSTLLGYALRAAGRQGKVTFYFENTPDPMDVKAMAEAEGVKIANLQGTQRTDAIWTGLRKKCI